VKLSDRNGTYISVVPVAYQFPESTSKDEFDWLVIEVNAGAASGAWSAQDACLTASEAWKVGEWLSSVAAGEVAPTLAEEDKGITPSLSFIEPSLAFSVAQSDDGFRHLRVHLTYELAPPWLDEDEKLVPWEYFVVVAMSQEDVLTAARSWKSDLAAFPER
jgi:hypothetical protein